VATFAIVMGVALLLTGIGFLVLTARVLWRAGAPAKTAPRGCRGRVACKGALPPKPPRGA
jgi:hypothetical protein